MLCVLRGCLSATVLRMRGVGVPEARSGFDSFSAVLAAHTSVPLVSLW